ncbi:hypothetical protein CGZ96_10950 [Enemella evansiae]|uniref:DODA-type extradiol aromatic ring-opening family dioxygenase n=1 Tax=Enemella evansiae TaxID=2016499 RepID=UPI000B95CB1C|nr:hypothetical protein [Enemella evansiae]OYN96812.1 hypothetical protein CGZ96_10950 [Enemella evansiae]
MAEIVTGFSASHAPMMSADPGSAPPGQAERFFAAIDRLTESVRESDAQALVMVSGEHFSNFFLDNLPQISIGLGETHLGPVEKWLGIDRVVIPGQPALADHILAGLIERDQLPALSHQLIVDHGFMTVYDKISPNKDLPLVPVVVNCTTPPLMTLRQAWNFGVKLGETIRDFDGLDRVAICGAGGVSHFVGEPRVGDLDEDFDRWFLQMLEDGCPDELLDLGNEELAQAGNGTGEVRAWVMVAGAMAGSKTEALAYEPIYEWINGMAAVLHTPVRGGA